MTDFKKILDKAKELEEQMKESQEKIKNIKVEGVSGANSVKVTLNGDGEMIQIEISPEAIKEEQSILLVTCSTSAFKAFISASFCSCVMIELPTLMLLFA